MKTNTPRIVGNQWLLVALIASGLSVVSYSPAAKAGGGAFVGGMIAGHVIGGAVRRDRQRTADMNTMAAQQTAAPVPAAAPAQQSPEARIQQLDKLAAGGYITPAEYKAKKQAILDSM